MVPCVVRSLLAALDFFLSTMSAFKALGDVQTTFGREGQSGHIERWRLYPPSWESLFQVAQDAMLLVGRLLKEVAASTCILEIRDRDLRDALGRALGAGERFERTLSNYRAALRDFEAAKAVFEADRSETNYRTKDSLDNRRGTWYRELHTHFTENEQALRRLNSVRDRLVAESERTEV